MAKAHEHGFLIDLAVGSLSAGVSKTIIAPVERVKLLLQLQDASSQISSQTKYTGIRDCVKRVFREQGFWSFWRGNLANIYRYFPTTAFSFATKDWFKRTFCGYDPDREYKKFVIGNIVSGGFAGASATFIAYPLDFARTRLAADVGRLRTERLFTGLLDCLQKIIRTEGVFGVYRGLAISLPGFMVYRAFYFGIYDSTMYTVKRHYQQPPIWLMLMVANSITMGGSLVMYPFDTVRRRLMMQSGRSDVLYAGAVDCVRKIYKAEGGLTAFYKGGLTNMFRSIGGAIVLVLYDKVKGAIG